MPAVQSGALAPLRSSYLKHLVESGEALQKRQDLPEAAFWDVAAFQRLTELESARSPSSPCPTAGSRRSIPTRTASTCPRSLPSWRCTRRGLRMTASTWTTVRSSGTSARCSSRSAPTDQKALFREGLRASNVWYGSFYTTVLIQSHLPPGFTATPYSQSGWCFVEATISSVIKDSITRFDVGALELDGAGNLIIDEDLETVMMRCMAAVAACPSGQTSSATSCIMRRSLRRTRTRQSWRTCTRASSTTSLAAAPSCFVALGWTDKEIRDLAGSLRLFEKLEELDLRSNEIGDEGAVALAGALKDLKHLWLVELQGNNIGLVGAAALRDVLQTDTELKLEGNPCEE